MLVIRVETPRDVGRVRMSNIAAFDQPDEALMVRILDSAAMAGAAGVTRYRHEFNEVAQRVN